MLFSVLVILHMSYYINYIYRQFPSADCATFSSKIQAQAKKWASADNCAQGGEKCLYKVTPSGSTNGRGFMIAPLTKSRPRKVKSWIRHW